MSFFITSPWIFNTWVTNDGLVPLVGICKKIEETRLLSVPQSTGIFFSSSEPSSAYLGHFSLFALIPILSHFFSVLTSFLYVYAYIIGVVFHDFWQMILESKKVISLLNRNIHAPFKIRKCQTQQKRSNVNLFPKILKLSQNVSH